MHRVQAPGRAIAAAICAVLSTTALAQTPHPAPVGQYGNITLSSSAGWYVNPKSTHSGEYLELRDDLLGEVHAQGAFDAFSGLARAAVVSTTEAGVAAAYYTSSDQLLISGGTGSGLATLVIHADRRLSSSVSDLGAVYARADFAASVSRWNGSAYDYVGGGIVEASLSVLGVQDFSNCWVSGCHVDAVAGTVLIPFSFDYGSYFEMTSMFQLLTQSGGTAEASGSVSLILPQGASLTALSGAHYSVTSAVPELATPQMLLLGLGLLPLWIRRRLTSVA